MDLSVYFALIIHILMAVTFIVLLLTFLYMIYRKEETK